MTSKPILRYILPLLLIVLYGVGFKWFLMHPKEIVKSKPSVPATLQVEVRSMAWQAYPITLTSYGTVTAQQRSDIHAEISAKVIELNPKFEPGQFLEQGTRLVTLDQRSVNADLEVAEAELSQAEAALNEERARARQAKKDWAQLHGNQPATDLALRKPQLASAEANRDAAQARLKKAQALHADSMIYAPYDCFVEARYINLGELATPNTALGTVISSDQFEVHLPLSLQETALLGWPELTPRITLQGQTQVDAQLHGITKVIDGTTQKQMLIARFQQSRPPQIASLSVGEFVTATIHGRLLSNVMVIPNDAIYQGDRIYRLDGENQLIQQQITPYWRDSHNTLIKNGLQQNDQIVITPLGKIPSGTRIEVTRVHTTEGRTP